MVDADRLEEAIEKGLGSKHLNLPKTQNYFRTSDGLELHFRVFVPENLSATKAVCFWGHGYGGHANRPITAKLAAFLTANNIALAAHDFRGHGYSQGERAFFTTHAPLLEDWLAFIQSFRKPKDADCAAVFVEPSVDVIDRLSTLPYFTGGQSMSGGLSTLLSLRLVDDPAYLGAVLLGPALAPSPVNPVVKWILCNVIAPLAPLRMLSGPGDNTSTLREEKDRKYIELDAWGNPDAIGWNRGMHIGTAAAFVTMFDEIEALMPHMRVSFLVFHDPEDQVTPYVGVQQLMALSPSEDKTEVTLVGGLHDVLTNEFDVVLPTTLKWVTERLAKLSAAR